MLTMVPQKCVGGPIQFPDIQQPCGVLGWLLVSIMQSGVTNLRRFRPRLLRWVVVIKPHTIQLSPGIMPLPPCPSDATTPALVSSSRRKPFTGTTITRGVAAQSWAVAAASCAAVACTTSGFKLIACPEETALTICTRESSFPPRRRHKGTPPRGVGNNVQDAESEASALAAVGLPSPS